MSLKLPNSRLLGLLGAALLAVYFTPNSDDDIVVPRKASHHTSLLAKPTQSTDAVEVLTLRNRDVYANEEIASGLFSIAKWRIATQPSAKISAQMPAQPSVPLAPPMPFRFLGRYADEGKEAIFLQSNERSIVVRVGDTIDEQYKIESLDDGILTLRYLPLNQVQTLDVGSQSQEK